MSSSPIMRNATVAATTSWRDLLSGLRQPGLTGVELVISDNHEGRKAAIARALPKAWQRCCVHLLRNALDDVPPSAERARRRAAQGAASSDGPSHRSRPQQDGGGRNFVDPDLDAGGLPTGFTVRVAVTFKPD
jgi:hypothetical protein